MWIVDLSNNKTQISGFNCILSVRQFQCCLDLSSTGWETDVRHAIRANPKTHMLSFRFQYRICRSYHVAGRELLSKRVDTDAYPCWEGKIIPVAEMAPPGRNTKPPERIVNGACAAQRKMVL